MYPIRTNVRSIYFSTGKRILRLSQSQFSTPYVLRRICLKPSRITTQNVYGKKPLFNTKVELYLSFKILRGFRTKKDQEAVTETKTLSVEDVSKTTSDLLKKIFSPAFIIIAFGITILWVVAHTQISFPLKKLISYGKTDFKAEIPNVSFNDVRGIDEVKQDLMDVVEYLKDPERFTNLGGKLPKGILLVGPPGTGKTLLARAIAGEAGVPFYYASGSEFDEMFVGVGSARIRGLFSEARENAPCIVFIDEIDACGSARTSSPLQPYARQTINQLLQEMDGFESNESVIVLGATNMRKVLDKALTRPGRFDTQINILAPDIKGRKDILELYVDKIVRSKDLDLERIACLTGGMTGADLSNLVNHAAIRAAQRNKSFVEMVDFEYSLDKLRMGPELKSRLRTEKELENTAFHEAGHALVAFYTPSAMPVFKVTIGQRGASLGHTSLIPKPEDEISSTRAKLIAQIDVAMGGRAAEEILSGKENVTTGASQDLEQATKIARHLVCDLGMSETLGFITYDYESTSPKNKKNIEIEVNQILTSSYNRATELLSKYSSEHKLLAKALLKYETLALDEIKVLFAQSSLAAVENLRKKQSSGEKTNVEPNESDMHDQYGLTPM